MQRHPLLVLAIAAATIVAACSSAGAPSVPAPTLAAALDGRTFLSTDLQGAVLVPGSRVSLTFTDGGLQASAGCNSMGGTYTIDGDRLTTTQQSMTQMACEEPRMQQDEWLTRFLGGATITLAGDTLTMAEGTVRLTLMDQEVATPDQPIEGTRWVVDGIVSGESVSSGSVSSVPAGVTATIRIADGRVDVEAGCNTGGGTVETAADTLTFGPIALTKMGCEPGAMAVEGAVIRVLAGAVGYTIQADVLTLDAGDTGLMLRATP